MSEGELPEGPTAPGDTGKREAAERFVTDVLRLMELAASVEVKEAEDGSLSVAVSPGVEVPQEPGGKRWGWSEALQFLANKVVNRPGAPRQWISLGIGAHPPPRGAGARGRPAPAAQPAGGGAPAPSPALPPRAARKQAAAPAKGRAPVLGPDERALEVSEDPALTEASRSLAEKSARLGRWYAIAAMSAEDRARVVGAGAGVEGVRLSTVGEGLNRRVVFQPERPVPMPKPRVLPVDDDEA